MKKRKRTRVFSRTADIRKALFISMARALLLQEKIQTTETRAKEIARFAEKLVTKAKKNTLGARRELLVYFEPSLVKKMAEKIAPRYEGRSGGYTKITKLVPRKSDGARMAIVELIP